MTYNGKTRTSRRHLYEIEITQIAYDEKFGAETKNEEDTCEFLKNRAACALTSFTNASNAQVDRITKLQLFKFSKNTLSDLSTRCVLLIYDNWIPNTGLKKRDKFSKKEMKFMEELKFQDVLCRLINLSRWWIIYRSKRNNADAYEFTQFMQHSCGNKFQAINTIRYFLNPKTIPLDVDVPVDVLPYIISKNFKKWKLEEFGLTELSLINWIRFIVTKPDLEKNPMFATKVHRFLAKRLHDISENDKEIIRQLLTQKKCVPTKFGMKMPSESYFQIVNNLFPNLPKIQFKKPLSVKNIMELLGVRRVNNFFL